MSVALQKQTLRQAVRARRSLRSPAAREAVALGLAAQISPLCSEARVIACYLPLPTEPDTRALLHELRGDSAHPHTLVVPLTTDDGLLAWVEPLGDELRCGRFNIPEPIESRPVAASDIELLILPALGIDHAGYRLGQGKGYYDKSLAAQHLEAPRIAVLFDDEYVPALPHEITDQRVNAAATPSRLIRIGDRLGREHR